MTKKLLALLLSLSFVFSVGCTGTTVINNHFTSSDPSEVVETVEITDDGSVSEEIIDSGNDSSTDGVSSVVASEETTSKNEPVGTVVWGEQNDYYPYFFTHLTDAQKTIYNNFFAAASVLSTERIYICEAADYKKSDISIAYMAFTSDNPDIFWLDGRYTIVVYKEDDVIVRYYVTLSYDRSYEQALQNSLALKEKLEGILAEVKNLGVLETERFFHDYL